MSKHNTPTCTHCGYEMEEEDLWADSDISKGDCDDSEIICSNPDCGKTFYVQCTHEIKFFQVDVYGEEIN